MDKDKFIDWYFFKSFYDVSWPGIYYHIFILFFEIIINIFLNATCKNSGGDPKKC